MADEEKVDSSEQTGEIEAEPKKKSLLKKFSDYVEKDNEKWENGGTKKAVQGRELSVEEKGKIKALATDFWNSYGKDHQDDVQSWVNHEKGQKLIKHFVSDGKNQELYTNCDAYKNCFDAYQKSNGDKNYNYDESSVDFNRLQTPYDVSFFIVLDGFPDWLLSTTNQHTKNFVMSRFKEGDSILSIVKVANEKLGKTAAASKDDKDAQKEGNESESEEKQEEQKTEEEIHEEQVQQKLEFDEFTSDCAKTQIHARILYGNIGNRYQKSFVKRAIDLKGYLSREYVNVFANLGDEKKAKDYYNRYREYFDSSFLQSVESNSQIKNLNVESDSQIKNLKDEFLRNGAQIFNDNSNRNDAIDQAFDNYIDYKNSIYAQMSGTEKEQ